MNIHLYILKHYILKNRQFLTFLPLVFVSIVVSAYLKVYSSIVLKDVVNAMTINTDPGYHIVKLGVCYLSCIFFIRFYELISTGPIQRAVKYASDDFLANIMSRARNAEECTNGEVARVLLRGSDAVGDIIEMSLLKIFPILVTFAITFYELNRTFGRMTMVLNVGILVLYTVTTCIITNKRMVYRYKANLHENKAHTKCLECLRNADTIIVHNMVGFEINNYSTMTKKVEKYRTRLYQSLALLNFSQESILYLFLSVYIYFKRHSFASDLLVQYIHMNREVIDDLDGLGCIYHRFYKAMVDLNTPLIRKWIEETSWANGGDMGNSRDASTANDDMTMDVCDMGNHKNVDMAKNDVSMQIVSGPARTSYIDNDDMCMAASDGQDRVNAMAMPVADTRNNISTYMPVIEFTDVTIVYNNNIILKNLVFTVNREEKIAIVGPNGTGKSSIIKSILNLIPYDGNIRKYGDIRIAYASQDQQLFNNSIFYNIVYGRPIDLQCVQVLAKKLGVHKDIMRMPGTYLRMVSENGRNLSGGEKQKIVLLRSVVHSMDVDICTEDMACYDNEHSSVDSGQCLNYACNEKECLKCSRRTHSEYDYEMDRSVRAEAKSVRIHMDAENGNAHGKHSLLLLDEATSAMDRTFERFVLKRLFRLCQKCTIVMVIHNLSLLGMFDRIIYVDRTIEMGGFDSLMSRKGSFHDFYVQLRKNKHTT